MAHTINPRTIVIVSMTSASKRYGHRRTHGMSQTRTYAAWANMLRRCYNPKHDRYDRYGGRGISVCNRWRKFAEFFADMGECPEGFSIERQQVDGNYEPTNCIWLPLTKQSANRRTVIRVLFEGREYCLAELARLHGLSPRVAQQRVKRLKWSPLRAGTEPLMS